MSHTRQLAVYHYYYHCVVNIIVIITDLISHKASKIHETEPTHDPGEGLPLGGGAGVYIYAFRHTAHTSPRRLPAPAACKISARVLLLVEPNSTQQHRLMNIWGCVMGGVGCRACEPRGGWVHPNCFSTNRWPVYSLQKDTHRTKERTDASSSNRAHTPTKLGISQTRWTGTGRR